MVEELVVRDEGLVELVFGHEVVEVVSGVGLVEKTEPEVGVGVRTGEVCFTG